MSEEMVAQINKLESDISQGRKRLSSDRMDISFGEIINLYRNNELIIRPEYQRLFRWNKNQKTDFIESLLMGIPVPPIFVAEDSNGVWEIIDGLQRVSTFISFFGELQENLTKHPTTNYIDDEIENEEDISLLNKWGLEPGSIIKSLEGYTSDTLPQKYLINLKRSVCRVEILRGESNTAMKYELFKRLNSGGSKLKPQEIRNAIYRGINPVVNELLEELSANAKFITMTALSPVKKQELYDQELVLRFVSFLNNVGVINDNMENYLNLFMKNSVEDKDFNKKYYLDSFNSVIDILSKLDDPKIFRNHRNVFVPAYFEGISIGVAQNKERYVTNSELLRTNIQKLKEDIKFKQFSGSASNSKSRIKNRLKRANEIFLGQL